MRSACFYSHSLSYPQHFVDYIKNDVLGRVCNTHVALADCGSPESIDCLSLAKLASQAVDFSKIGVPVSPRDIPPVSEYPDFMGKVSDTQSGVPIVWL